MLFSVVVACTDPDGGIGINGHLAWNIPEDMRQFARITTGGAVIMGRHTWESIPTRHRPLKNRINIVISSALQFNKSASSASADAPNYIVKSLDHALELLDDKHHGIDVYVIGGEQLYNEAITHPNCKGAHVTLVQSRSIICDRFFPMTQLHELFECTYMGSSQETNGIQYVFSEFHKKNS